MVEIPLAYFNKLATQVLFISALLGGFSLAVIVSLLNNKHTDRITTTIFKTATVSTASFLISIFAMTRIMLMTTEGFPGKVTDASIMFPRLVGTLGFFIGIVALIILVSLSGWVKSKSLGRFTTILGIIAFIIVLLMLIQVGP